MRRDYDGVSDEALADPTVDCREFISGSDFDGEGAVFWLRYIILRNSHATNDAIIEVYDQNEGVAVAASKVLVFDAPAVTTTILELPAPGKSFKVNITGGVNGATGTVAAYEVAAGGYLVGGME